MASNLRRGIRRVLLPLVLLIFVQQMIAARLERRSLASQNPQAAPAGAVVHRADPQSLMRDVNAFAAPELEGRAVGTPGGRRARELLVRRFQEIGLAPAGTQGYLQPFSFEHRSIKGLFLPNRPFRTEFPDAANVLGKIPGNDPGAPWIVLSAHYDHLGIVEGRLYFGADDNASGLAVLLAAAAWFRQHSPRHSLLFAAFDAEEKGLRGAEAFLEAPTIPRERISVNVNLDMVSRNDENEIFAAGTWHEPGLRGVMEEVQKVSAVKILYGHDKPRWRAGGAVDDWTGSSDHGVFHDAGIPFLYFGVEDHPDYHQPTDTPDKIDPRFLARVADMMVETVVRLDQ